MTLMDPTNWPPEVWAEAQRHAPLPPPSELVDMMFGADPWPHYVHYQACRRLPIHVSPESFYLHRVPLGPSDCDWIVPGTGERR